MGWTAPVSSSRINTQEHPGAWGRRLGGNGGVPGGLGNPSSGQVWVWEGMAGPCGQGEGEAISPPRKGQWGRLEGDLRCLHRAGR